MKDDWEKRLEQRHATPPPAPRDEWDAIQARVRPSARRFAWPAMAIGSALAILTVAALLWVPISQSHPKATQALEEDAALDKWVSQQWSGEAAVVDASGNTREPGANLLALIDED